MWLPNRSFLHGLQVASNMKENKLQNVITVRNVSELQQVCIKSKKKKKKGGGGRLAIFFFF